MKPKASLRFFLALSGSSLLVISSAHADTVNWDGDTSADWANANNWDTAPLATDIANFNLATYGGNPVFAPDAGTTSINGITIGAGNGAMTLATTNLSIGNGGITMANGAGAFTVAGGVTLGASQIWTNNASSLFTADGAVNGSSANTNLELMGNGSFVFNNAIGSNVGHVEIKGAAGSSVTFTTANTFTGNLHLYNGSTLNFSAVNQLSSGTGSYWLAIQNGSKLNYTGSGSESISSRRIYWNIGAANVDVANAGANLALDLDTLGGNRNQTFNKGGAGTLTFTGTGGVTGNVNINNGTLKLSQTTGYASPTTTVGASGTLELNKTAPGYANRVPQLTRNITGDGTLNINSDTSGIGGGWVTLIAGGGNLVNFTGTINVKSGVLSMDNLNGTLTGNPDLNVEAGGLFGIRGQNISVDALTGNGDVFNNWNGDLTGHTFTVGANNGSGTFSGVIHGNNSNLTDGTIEAGKLHLTKTGTGTQILTGANTYSGLTTVANGTLLIDGSTSTSSAVTVNGGTLGGIGAIGGSVTVNSGASLSPGASIQSLATGALTMTTGSTFAYEVADNTGIGADLLAANGMVSLAGVTLSLDAATLAALGGGGWSIGNKLTLMSYIHAGSGITSGFTGYADDTSYLFGTNHWMFDYNDTLAGGNFGTDAIASSQNRFVTLTLVPEPRAALLGGLGLLALLRRRRN